MRSSRASLRSITRAPWLSLPSTRQAARCSASCACTPDADYDRGEYAILVRSDLKGHGLGWLLMQLLIEYARAEGIRAIEGQVLAENTSMLKMCRELGFEISHDPDDPGSCRCQTSVAVKC